MSSGKKKSATAVGHAIEDQIAGLLTDAGWLTWIPPKTHSFGSKDVWGVFDIPAIRGGSRVIGVQSGVLSMAAQKKRKVGGVITPVYAKDPRLLDVFSPQVWVANDDGKTELRAFEMVGITWVEIGRCTLDGDPLGDYQLPWPLFPPDPPYRTPKAMRPVRSPVAFPSLASTFSGASQSTMTVSPMVAR